MPPLVRLILAVAMICPLMEAQTNGALAGTVKGDDGGPLLNARVVVQLRSPGTGPVARSGDTGPRGEYSFTNLPPGTYEICAAAKSAGYINHCASMAMNERVVTVKAGETAVAPTITLRRTVRFVVTVDDPTAVLQRAQSGPSLVLRAGVPGYPPVSMLLAQTAGSRRVYEALVPRQTTVKLHVFSPSLDVVDSRSVPLAANHTQDVVVGAGDPGPIAITVRGARAASAK